MATFLARSDQRATCVATTAGPVILSRTDIGQPMVVMAPMPTLILGFNTGTATPIGMSRGAQFVPHPGFRPPPPAPLATAPTEPEPALAAAPVPADQPAPEPERTEAPIRPVDNANRIELIIDSLPSHQLTESIPVTITPMGNEVFTAAMRDVDVSASGSGVGESLLVLKEQIEFLYDDLRQRTQMSAEQKQLLEKLKTYIAQPGARPAWG